MKKVEFRFEREPALTQIEVVIRAPEEDAQVASLIRQLGGEAPETLRVFDGEGGVRSLDTREIILASVADKLVNIVTADGSWYCRRTLQTLEGELDGQRFLRISRYEIVNIDKIRRYDFTVAGTLRLELEGGTVTWASRRCIPAIRKRLTERE